MSDYDIDDILTFTAQQSPTKVQDAVNQILGQKSFEALTSMRSAIAQDMYGSQTDEDEELEDDEEELEVEDTDEEDLDLEDEDIDWEDEDLEDLDLDIDLEELEDDGQDS